MPEIGTAEFGDFSLGITELGLSHHRHHRK
jgi:hypothetical protein